MTDQSPSPVAGTESPERSLRWAVRIAAGLVAVLLVGGTLRLGASERAARGLEQQVAERLQPSVSVVQAKAGASQLAVQLPATLRGYQEALIYARTGGYVGRWHKEIGDQVKHGEVLVSVSAPEQEQELLQARATREQIQARTTLARTSLKRWEAQRQFQAVSQQQFEEKSSEAEQAAADLAAADANVLRLQNVLALQQVRAPFDGVITRRHVDTGALVIAGTTELFAMAQVKTLRLTVWVPQSYASEVRRGQLVSVRVHGVQNAFPGTIEHVSGAIDVSTRSRQVDIAVPNEDGRLLPGAYAEVGLSLNNSRDSLLIPPSVLVINKDGPRVAVVGPDDRIVFRSVRLGRDLGKEIEVLEGISATDRLVTSPADLLRDGDSVKVKAASST
jgi:RND family efflux transporter MFP subunit